MDVKKLFRPSEIRHLSKDETMALYKRHMLAQHERAEAAEQRAAEMGGLRADMAVELQEAEIEVRRLEELVAEMEKALVELARWSQVATRNGDLHARVASALALSAREEAQ
jgi:hypothetical protein